MWLRIYVTFSADVHTQETRRQFDVRSFTMPGLPAHLVQELKTCTVRPRLKYEQIDFKSNKPPVKAAFSLCKKLEY